MIIPLGDGADADRFVLLHTPCAQKFPRPRGLVVQVAALAEEMNKSRRMAALQSRALSEAGYAVLQLDLFGCGDSDGDFADASWQRWVDDVAGAARWLQALFPGAGTDAPPLWLWGHRVGALLCHAAADQLEIPCGFIFWQPVIDGKAAWHQWLRIKAASELATGTAKEAMAAARAAVAAGQSIEIGGYVFNAALAAGLEAARLLPAGCAGAASRRPVAWLEVGATDATLSPAGAAAVQAWRDAGFDVQALPVGGPAFWQTAEIEEAPALVPATLQALDALSPPTAGSVAAGPLAAQRTPPVSQPLPAQPRGVVFGCHGENLVGVIHPPLDDATDLGVVIVVGGPQYRIGSHRQFVVLANALAAAGIAVLRFDVRGMGDSSGAPHAFETLADDIAAAIDALQRTLPQVRRVALWGLCDGASAALLYLDERSDARIAGVALANPWVRSPLTQARTRVKHYYARRLFAPEFWRKLLKGAVSPRAAAELVSTLWNTRAAAAPPAQAGFQARMLRGWTQRDVSSLVLLSEHDHTAREFVETMLADAAWQRALQRGCVVRRDVDGADHTFSTGDSAAQVAALSVQWAIDLARQARPAALQEPAFV